MEILIGLVLFAFLLVVVAGSVIGIANASLPRRVRELRDEVGELKARVQALEGTATAKETAPSTEAPASDATLDAPAVPDAPAAARPTVKPPREPTAILERFRRAEGRFASYWTGILGVLALVVGFSFLAILTALRLGEFPRFLMLCGVALVFYGGSLAIRRRNGGELFAAWFRSASGALVLFACVGSSAIPWLRWVQSEPQGYALLAAGLAVNLWFTLKGPYQLFAAFHTLISLTALAVAPPQVTVLAAAAIVTALSTLPGRRQSWWLHLLASQTVFFAFVVAWNVRQPLAGPVVEGAAVAALLVGLMSVLLGPYISRDKGVSAMALTVRGAAWLYLAAGTVAVGQSIPGISLIFLALALAAYLPGRIVAPERSALRTMDTLAGLTLALLAGIGLVRLELDLYSAVAVAAGIASLAAFDLRRQGLAAMIALVAAAVLTVVLAAATSGTLPLFDPIQQQSRQVPARVGVNAVIAVVALAELRFVFSHHRIAQRVLATTFFFASLGLLNVVLTAATAPTWFRYSGAAVLPLVVAAALIGTTGKGFFGKDRAGNARTRVPNAQITPWLGLAVLALVAAAHWVALAGGPQLGTISLVEQTLHALLLIALALVAAVVPSPAGVLPGVLLATADLARLVFVLTASRDPWVGLTVWTLVAAAVYLPRWWLKNRRRDLGRSLTIAGAGTALAAAAVSVPSVLDGSAAQHPVLRVLLIAVVTATLVIWGRRTAAGPRAARPVLIVAAVLYLVVTVGAEAGVEFTGLVLAVLSLLLFLVGLNGPRYLRMLFSLSTAVFWSSLVFLPLVALFSGSLRITVFSGEWYRALVSAVLASIYLGLSWVLRPYWGRPIEEEGAFAARWKHAVGTNLYRLLFLPFFVSLGLFFVLSFSGPVLTALLIIESFIIFSLGIVLREKSFRPFGYALLVVSLGRLVFFDMAESDTLERALVFLIAGAVLLGMNWMYNRFRR